MTDAPAFATNRSPPLRASAAGLANWYAGPEMTRTRAPVDMSRKPGRKVHGFPKNLVSGPKPVRANPRGLLWWIWASASSGLTSLNSAQVVER